MTFHLDFGQGVAFLTPGAGVFMRPAGDDEAPFEEVGQLVSMQGTVHGLPIVNIPREEGTGSVTEQ